MPHCKRVVDFNRVKTDCTAFAKKNFCIFIIFTVILMTAAIVRMAFPLCLNAIDSEKNATFEAAWQYSVDGGEFLDAELPYIEKGAIKSDITLKNTIPNVVIKGATILLRTSQQNAEVFVDESCIYRSFSNEESKIPSSAYHFVRLPADAAGKEISVILSSPYPRYSGMMEQIYIGSKASNVFFLIRRSGLRFIAGLIVFIIGLLLTVTFLFTRAYKNTLGIIYLGSFFVCAGHWVMVESRMMQFIVPYPLALTNSSIYALTLLPIFAGLYFHSGQSNSLRSERKAIIVAMFFISLSIGIIAVANPLMPLVVFPAYLVVLGICMTAVFIWIVADSVKKKRKFSIAVLGGVLFACCCLAELTIYFSDVKNYNHSNLMTLGLFIFCVMMLTDLGQNFMRIYRDSIKVKALTVLAYTDSLTGLPNRTAFLEMMSNVDVEVSRVTIGMFDINYLKETNDTMGHLVGDAMIRHSAKVIKNSIREEDAVYRIGGDEFAVIFRHDSELIPGKLERRLLDTMAKENQKALSYRLSIAYGYATFSDQQDKNLFDTLAVADANMYACKRKQKGELSATGKPGEAGV